MVNSEILGRVKKKFCHFFNLFWFSAQNHEKFIGNVNMHACLLFIRFSKSFANVANTFGNQIIGFLVSMLGSVVQSGRIGFNQISENEEI